MTNINCKRITITRGELMQWLVLQNLLQYYLPVLLSVITAQVCLANQFSQSLVAIQLLVFDPHYRAIMGQKVI